MGDLNAGLPHHSGIGQWGRRMGAFGLSFMLVTSLAPSAAFADGTDSAENHSAEVQDGSDIVISDESDELSDSNAHASSDLTDSSSDGNAESANQADSNENDITDGSEVHEVDPLALSARDSSSSFSDDSASFGADANARSNEDTLASGQIGATTWTVTSGNVLTLSYSGSWEDYNRGDDNEWVKCGELDTSEPLTVVFSEGVEGIPSSFGYVTSRQFQYGKIVLPSTIKSIPANVLNTNTKSKLPDAIEAPSTVFDGTYLYSDSTKTNIVMSLASVTEAIIPSGVKTISSLAFKGLALSKVYIPASVEEINVSAFKYAVSIDTVELDPENSNGFYFQNDVTLPDFRSLMNSSGNVVIPVTVPTYTDAYGVVYSIDRSILYGAPDTLSGSYQVADGCVTILDGAFDGCVTLTSIALPASVQAIGTGVFSGCTSLASANIPSALAGVPDDLFNGCSSLASIDIPSGITSIGNRAFQGCSSLTEVSVPDSVTTIGLNAFENCTSLETLRLSASLTSLQNYAFQNCTSLKYITMPDGMTNIGPFAFNGCTSLETVVIPDSVTYIDVAAFANTNIKTFIAPSGLWSKVESHDKFSGDSDSVWNTAAIFTSTSATVFSGQVSDKKVFSSVESIDLSRYTRDYIPTYMFMGLNKLTEVQIPANIRIIDSGAFFMCTGLRDVYMYNQSPSIAGAGTTGDPTLGWTSSTRPAFSYWTWNAIEGWVVVSMSDLNLHGLAYGNNDMIAYAAENDCNFIPFVVLDNYDTKSLFGFDITGYNNIEIADMVYTGEALTPQVIATFTDADLGSLERNLTNDSGCTIVYKDANGNTVSEIVGAGTYTAQITGDNKSVFGTKTIQFEVVDPAAAQEGQQQGGQQQDDQQQGSQQQGTQQNTQQLGTQQQGGVVYPAGYTQQQATSSMAQTGDGTDVAPLAVASLAALGVAAASAAVVSRKRSAKSADEHDAR